MCFKFDHMYNKEIITEKLCPFFFLNTTVWAGKRDLSISLPSLILVILVSHE